MFDQAKFFVMNIINRDTSKKEFCEKITHKWLSKPYSLSNVQEVFNVIELIRSSYKKTLSFY